MCNRSTLTALVLALATITTPSLKAQAPPAPTAALADASVMEALIRDVEGVERKLMGLTDVIPEAAFAWTPGDGVRTVAQVLMHVAADNYFIPTMDGVDAPVSTGIRGDSYPSVQAYEGREVTKAEAMDELRVSFGHLKRTMRAVDGATLGAEVDVFGTPVTRLDLWVMATTHLHEHLGQLIAYARSNAVVPPWSQ